MATLIDIPLRAPASGVRARPHSRRAVRLEPQAPSASPRARLNLLPSSDLLELLIEEALDALARGFTWDRGAMVNMVL